jgi:hypothetical protein
MCLGKPSEKATFSQGRASVWQAGARQAQGRIQGRRKAGYKADSLSCPIARFIGAIETGLKESIERSGGQDFTLVI